MSEVVVRALTADDLPALAIEVERARAAGEFQASSDPHGSFFLRSIELRSGGPVAIALDGPDLVGFLSTEFKVIAVRPSLRRRGIGRRLVEIGLGLEAGRGRPELFVGRAPDDDAGRAFLEATGFAWHSTLWDLELPPEARVAAPTWPAGIAARPFERGRDARPFMELFNAAFATHATPLQIDEAALDQPPDPTFEDADTVVLEEADTAGLVGFCATTPERTDGVVGPHAEIWTIGVRPDRQGRGLGRQLLRWGVERLRSLGARDVTLSVNSRNEHALELYEREGFVRTSTRERWSRPVRGAVD